MKLVIETPGEPARAESLHDAPLQIGRDPGCDIVISHPGVSRVHARLNPGAEGWVLEDGGSQNGTWVNEEPIESAILQPGDVIRLGPEVLVRVAEDEPRERAHESRAEPRSASPIWTERWDLEGIVDETNGLAFRIERRATNVGRDPGVGVTISHDSVSRMHARLDREPDGLYVVDLKSRNGTYVNGADVERERLADGDVVAFGLAEFRVRRRRTFAGSKLIAGLGLGARPRLQCVLEIVDGPEAGCRYEIFDLPITLGAAAGNDIVIADSTVSRAHALLEEAAGAIEIVDQNSRHGTFVNGEPIDRVRLASGDHVMLSENFGFRYREE